MKKTDCIFYAQTRRGEYCKGLKELYCISEKCRFYKPESTYNPDGTKKGGKHCEDSVGN